MKQNTEVL